MIFHSWKNQNTKIQLSCPDIPSGYKQVYLPPTFTQTKIIAEKKKKTPPTLVGKTHPYLPKWQPRVSNKVNFSSVFSVFRHKNTQILVKNYYHIVDNTFNYTLNNMSQFLNNFLLCFFFKYAGEKFSLNQSKVNVM